MNSKIPTALLDALRSANAVTVLTGAGISAESGVPTFRDALTGLWSKYEPEQLATPEAFRANPKLVWDWYAWRRQQVKSVQPNPGHYALAQLEQRFRSFTLVTQNVDGLHRRAGSQKVLELHGNIERVKCLDEDHVVDGWEEREDGPPPCPRCGSFLRPDVVWFGETLPEAVFAEADRASRTCDVFLSIGTSSLVYPAAGLPLTAVASGAVVVEINPNPTSLTSRASFSFKAQAGEFLPELVSLLQ